MRQLKPCPFCGGKAYIWEDTGRIHRPYWTGKYSVVCYECDVLFGYDVDYGGCFDSKEDALNAWNRRYKE